MEEAIGLPHALVGRTGEQRLQGGVVRMRGREALAAEPRHRCPRRARLLDGWRRRVHLSVDHHA
ncbi:MAG: hypothetical protein ING90_15620 [Rhodocyclaceae bacterium]|nr:hypothetical protein [Rhodocyclaceae bacterium]MCA3124078.1 hypothetical protein [Rhodocyclaceae bacterium]MCA3127930.1 hypothetical protein [Rhodocyclaceae bacterium]MCA3138180.1 hypothetical protein [Rhodocyclaceae bacterium]